MKYEILLLGKTKDPFLAQGISEYSKRLNHYATVNLRTLKVKRFRGEAEKIKEKEAELLLANISSTSRVVALDAKGQQYHSEGFSQLISRWENSGANHISLIVGGPFGLSSRVLNKAQQIISLSKMTFTHDMVRLFLLEQLYRAYTIKAGEQYHK